MAKVILTAALLAEGADALTKAIAENPAAAANDILQLKADDNDALQKENEQLKELIENLTAELEKLSPTAPVEAKKAELSKLTFKVGTKQYGFVYPQIKLDGAIITNDDVLASKELQEKLVKMGSGFIVAK